jgi:uncharacterized protein YyaL (SSP411 family)
MKEDYDGAEPTASSVSVLNLLVLSHLVEDPGWTERVDRTLRYFGTRLEQMGRAVPLMAAALSTWTAGVQQVVLIRAQQGGDAGGAGDPGGPGDPRNADGPGAIDGALGHVIAMHYLPFAITLTLTRDQQQALAARMPFVAAMQPVGGAPAAYVCRQFTCRPPVTTAEALAAELTAAV